MEKPLIMIVDYRVGNIHSVGKALEYLGYRSRVSASPDLAEEASAFILPGVGAFGEGMANLRRLGLIEVLNEQVLGRSKPVLGICLGMQLMAESSEENGFHQGLGWIQGRVVRFGEELGVKVPHVGWNDLAPAVKDPLFSRTDQEANFYFDHSYYLECPGELVAARAEYGRGFAAAVRKGNIFGVQFHPEKSQKNGLKLLRGLFSHLGF